MPGPQKKVNREKVYKEDYSTKGQRITNDGSEVIMNNGRRFKRVVLPSVAVKKAEEIKEEVQLEEAIEELDQLRTQEQD